MDLKTSYKNLKISYTDFKKSYTDLKHLIGLKNISQDL